MSSPANFAVMLALPAATPITIPVAASTVATLSLSDDQVIVLSDNVCSPTFKVGVLENVPPMAIGSVGIALKVKVVAVKSTALLYIFI